jgi:hypothetical protein
MSLLGRSNGRASSIVSFLLILTARLSAQAPQGCEAPEHRQFDFWIGSWTVATPQGNLAGTNRIDRTLKGCVLLENWSGSKGGSGTSFNLWTASDGKWHQVWVDDSGNMLNLSGGLEGTRMVLTGAHPTPGSPGTITTERITWTPLAGGTVRQHWEASTDGGATWTTQFDGLYTPSK